MTTKKIVKCIIGILAGLVCIALIAVLVIYHRAMTESYEDDLTTMERDIKIVTETYPTQFIVYGDKMDLDKYVGVKYIDELSEEVLELSSAYKYQLIIINDLNGTCDMSEDDWQLLNDLVISGKRRNLFYFGNKEFNRIKELDIADVMLAYEDEDLSVGFVYEKDLLVTVSGTYTKDAKYMLEESLLHEQANSIKVSNE